jgi:hypothetical protein
MVVANNEFDKTKNAGKSTTISTQSHWMPPSGKCLRRIALTATMVDEFE